MSAYQRRKGHDWEREVARLFREAMPGAEVRRGLQYRDGSECPDVTAPGWHIECKRGRKPSLRLALKQAIGDAQKGLWRCAVVKDDREEPLAIMPLDDLLDLVHEHWEATR